MPRKAEAATKKTIMKKTTRKKVVEAPEESTPAVLETTSPRSSTINDIMNLRTLIILVVVGVLLILGYMLYRWVVIAWVDGKPLTRFALYKQMESRYGSATQDQMISENLVMSEARRKGVTVQENEIDAEIKKFEDQLGGKDQLDSALKMQGVSLQDLRKNVRLQLIVKKIFINDAKVSDEEVMNYFTNNKAQLPPEEVQDGTPSAKLRQQILDQLQQQKLSQSFQTWLDQTKGSSRVKKVQTL
jgi:hypothetical protein